MVDEHPEPTSGADPGEVNLEPTSGADPEEVRDELPEELDRGFVGPYTFPPNQRRRIQGAILIVAGLVGVGLAVVGGGDAVLVNGGVAVAGIGLVLFGLYSMAAGARLGLDENEALVVATRAVAMPVGHASAQLGWRGLVSRPTWRMLVYSADDPPSRRALVLVDGIDGSVVDQLVEDNPEDWTGLSGANGGRDGT